MKITILNGDPEPGSAFQGYLGQLEGELAGRGCAVRRLDLARMEIKGCTGCFNCWVRTPGECARRDESALVCQAVLGADLVLLASPLRLGFVSSALKAALDQLVPILHPYFEFEGGEVHHRARYSRYPRFALLLSPGADADAEDVEITQAILGRTARNMKSRLACTILTSQSLPEEAREKLLVA